MKTAPLRAKAMPAFPWNLLRPRSAVACLLLGMAVLCLASCSRSHELETARVRGTVTLNGKPLEAGGVLFMPPRGRAATGMIQPDGTYVIGTYRDDDGAVVGPHRVTVTPRIDRSENEELAAQNDVFMLRKPISGIEVIVEPSKDNVIDIPLSETP